MNRDGSSADVPQWSLFPPSPEEVIQPRDPLEGWSKIRKLAVFLMMLGEEQASILLREFADHEVSDIVLEMAALEVVSPQQQEAVLQEFGQVAQIAETGKRGGPEFAREVLEMRLGTAKANEIISRIAPEVPSRRGTGPPATFRQPWSTHELFEALTRESLQTQALVISYMQPAQGADLLVQFSPPHRVAVIERIGQMEPLPPEFVAQILQKVKERCRLRDGPQFAAVGGSQSLAQLLNSMREADLQQTLTELQLRDPKLSLKVRQLLVVFDDLARFDDASLLEVIRGLDITDLAKVLKAAPDGVQEAMMRALPVRRAEFLRLEMANLPAIRLTEVQSIQGRLLKAVNHLQEQGILQVPRFEGPSGS